MPNQYVIFIPKLNPYLAEKKVRTENLRFKVDIVGGRSCQSAC